LVARQDWSNPLLQVEKLMILQGTVVNMATIVAGVLIGRWAGRHLSARMRQTLMIGLGLAVLLIGLKLALQSQQVMVVIGSLIFGGLIGEALGIERRLEEFGQRLQQRFAGLGAVAEGFVTASLLYCVGAMAIMGALQDGMGDKPTILYAKAALDGVASIALTSTLGIGVIFSIFPLALYQGVITLAAGLSRAVLTDAVIVEMNAVGGLLIVAIAFDLMGIKRLPVGNLLPAVFVAIGLLWAFGMA
jgi:uncharacterized membrane protein YqgA involved in biofilm formation